MNKSIIKKVITIFVIAIILYAAPVFADSASLKILGITPNDFSGFKENTTSYSVTVPNSVKSVKVYATAKESSAKVEGTGTIDLEEGKNKAEVVVTAKDGSTKTYTINIKRLKAGESELTSNATELDENLGLTKLEIEGCTIEPSFNKDTHQYTVDVPTKQQSLKIASEATSENAKVIVKGNTNLIKGQNIVNIMVTDDNENSVSTYQLYVNNQVAKPEEITKHYQEAEKNYNIKKWITIIFVIIILISLLVLKRVLRIRKALRRDKYEYIEDEEDSFNNYNKSPKNQLLSQNESEEEMLSKSARQIRENYEKINNRIENESKKSSKKAKHGRHSK